MNTYTEKEIERLLKNKTIDDITYKSTERLHSVILNFHLAIEANIIDQNKKKPIGLLLQHALLPEIKMVVWKNAEKVAFVEEEIEKKKRFDRFVYGLTKAAEKEAEEKERGESV